MRVVAIVQSRFGSVRLPGKALRPLASVPMLVHVLSRVKSAGFDDVWVTTPDTQENDPIADLSGRLGFSVHRGGESDVLGRMYEAATAAKAEVVVRVTGDCPLWAPDVGRRVVDAYLKLAGSTSPRFKDQTIVSNDTMISGYPDGLDTEVFSIVALEKAYTSRENGQDMEHVTRWMYRNMRHEVVFCDEDWRRIKMSVDSEEDLQFVSRVLLGVPSGRFDWPDTRTSLSRLINNKARGKR